MKGKKSSMVIVLHIIMISLSKIASSQEQIDHLFTICQTSENVSATSTYHDNIASLLDTLANRPSRSKFFNASVGDGEDLVNGLYVCRPDLSLDTCNSCVTKALATLRTFCSIKKEAIIWFEQCMVRYTNLTISGSLQITPFKEKWRTDFKVSEPDIFSGILNKTLEMTITEASTNKDHFAFNNNDFTAFEGCYGMAWCTPDITPVQCESCLTTAFTSIQVNSAASWGYILYPSCVLRYDTAPFIFPTSPPVLAPTPAAR